VIKVVLFDLDGTLIQTTEPIMETFKITFEHFFKEVTLTQEVLTSFLGQTLYQTFRLYESNEEKIEDIIQFYRKTSEALLDQGLDAYPHAETIMAWLKKKHIKVGIVTSKMNRVAKEHLHKTNLLPYVDHIVGYEDVIQHKPNKEPIEKALQFFQVSPDETVYIGDHENDIKAAKHAGCLSCGVTYSHRLQALLAEMPDYVIDELHHIKDLI
jgi:HAD superfamily hydrolase (TIGR01509 family)